MKTLIKNLFPVASVVVGLFLINTTASLAATPGEDDAANPAYTGGWNNGADGGLPTFGPWSLSTSNTSTLSGTTDIDTNSAAGFFIGDSTGPAASGNGAGTGNINTGANDSFALFAHFGTSGDGGNISADASRSFDSALSVGQTFSIQLGVNFRNGNKGIDILSGATNIFNLNIGGNTYTVNNTTTGSGDLFGDVYDPQSVFTISLIQTSLTGGNWTVVRSGTTVSTGTANGTYTGDPTSLHLYNSSTDANSLNANNLYVNNLKIVPEPASYAMALIGFGILFGLRKLRRKSYV